MRYAIALVCMLLCSNALAQQAFFDDGSTRCDNGVCSRPVANAIATVVHAPVHIAHNAATTVHCVTHGVASGLAQAKANVQASRNHMHHVAGGLGCGRFEGVGFSTISAQHAIQNSCYWGRKTPVEIGVARGTRGWFATVIYR